MDKVGIWRRCLFPVSLDLIFLFRKLQFYFYDQARLDRPATSEKKTIFKTRIPFVELSSKAKGPVTVRKNPYKGPLFSSEKLFEVLPAAKKVQRDYFFCPDSFTLLSFSVPKLCPRPLSYFATLLCLKKKMGLRAIHSHKKSFALG